MRDLGVLALGMVAYMIKHPETLGGWFSRVRIASLRDRRVALEEKDRYLRTRAAIEVKRRALEKFEIAVQEAPGSPGKPPVHQGKPPVHQGKPPVHQGKPPVHQGEAHVHQGKVSNIVRSGAGAPVGASPRPEPGEGSAGRGAASRHRLDLTTAQLGNGSAPLSSAEATHYEGPARAALCWLSRGARETRRWSRPPVSGSTPTCRASRRRAAG